MPVKDASGDFGTMWGGADQGQWFKGGAIVRINGSWQIRLGDFGQTAGRFAEDDEPAADLSPGLLPDGEPPEITDEMREML